MSHKRALVIFLPVFTLLVGTIVVLHFSQTGAHLEAMKVGEVHSIVLERK